MSSSSDFERACYGWESDFPTSSETEPRVVHQARGLRRQRRRVAVPHLDDSHCLGSSSRPAKVVEVDALAREYTAILEYDLPMEPRRPDVVLLVSGAVVVLELKGRSEPVPGRPRPGGRLRARPTLLPSSTAPSARSTPSSCPPARPGTSACATACACAGRRRSISSSTTSSVRGRKGPLTAEEFLACDASCPSPRLCRPRASSSSTARSDPFIGRMPRPSRPSTRSRASRTTRPARTYGTLSAYDESCRFLYGETCRSGAGESLNLIVG